MASSAASGASGMIQGVRHLNSSSARCWARGVTPETLCGSEAISLSAKPYATRSGQKATSMSKLSLLRALAMRSVVPG